MALELPGNLWSTLAAQPSPEDDMTTSRPTRGLSRRPVQERSQQTVKRILEATLSLLAREGVEGLTTNSVAAEAGLSVASLYRFFPNKQALIYATYAEWIDELSARIGAVCDHWQAVLEPEPDRWPEAAEALSEVLGESRRGARVEYELLRAMFSHRELRALDDNHTSALAGRVAQLMRTAGATLADAELETIAAFSNEQFTLAAELEGRRGQRLGFVAHAQQAHRALWLSAISAQSPHVHREDNRSLDMKCK
jgi:AcrR family transcriptional regulator